VHGGGGMQWQAMWYCLQVSKITVTAELLTDFKNILETNVQVIHHYVGSDLL
jgi:hypothetical protein